MTDTGPSAAAPRRWPRWKGILLVVSLALNLLVVGIVATAAVRHRLAPPPGTSQATVLSYARTLPDPRRRDLWEATRAERTALRPYRAELRRARDEVRKTLVAEPFDASKFKAAHAHLLEAEDGARRAAHVLFETVAMRLTADERRAFVRWQVIAERPWRRHRFKGGSGDGDEDLPVGPGEAKEKK